MGLMLESIFQVYLKMSKDIFFAVDEAPLVECTLCGFHNDGITSSVKLPVGRRKFFEMM